MIVVDASILATALADDTADGDAARLSLHSHALAAPTDQSEGRICLATVRSWPVLPFDSSAATHDAEVAGARDQIGLPIDGFDAQIASICRANGAALATGNLKDFRHTAVNLIDPWQRP